MTQDTPQGERIAKILSRAGIASRREAERMIAEGRVKLNGKVIDSPALNVTAKDRITVDDAPVAEPEPPRLWLYHKPTGLVTTERDEMDRPTVFASLPEDMPRVVSIGRLDLNSEGLLLLTNDGELKRRLELPSTGWQRRYRVRIKGDSGRLDFDSLRAGVEIDGVQYQPMEIRIDKQQGSNAWLTVSIREGKNREIRRAMASIGADVNRLIRISYGPFQLGNLKAGEVEEVRRRVLRDQLGLDAEMQPLEESKSKPVRSRKPRAADGGTTPATYYRAGSDQTAKRSQSERPFGKSPKPRPESASGDTARGDAAKNSTRSAPRPFAGRSSTGRDEDRPQGGKTWQSKTFSSGRSGKPDADRSDSGRPSKSGAGGYGAGAGTDKRSKPYGKPAEGERKTFGRTSGTTDRSEGKSWQANRERGQGRGSDSGPDRSNDRSGPKTRGPNSGGKGGTGGPKRGPERPKRG